MGLEFCCVFLVLSTLAPSYDFRVIPKENEYQKENWIPEKYVEEWDKSPDDIEESDTEEIHSTTDASLGIKMKKNRKTGPKQSIFDTRYPDRPDLVLFTFSPELMSDDEKEKLLHMVDSKFGHLVDSSILKKVAEGDLQAVPNIWNFLSNYDIKGAFTALAAQQLSKSFASASEHPVESGKSREECRKLCKDKETELVQLINGVLIRLTQMDTNEGEDIRIRLRPSHKKCFKYEPAKDDKPSMCTCTSAPKNIYVSPQLKEIINRKFFTSKEGENEIEEFIENAVIAEKPSENNNSSWSFTKFGHIVLNSMGYGSDKRRRREPKRYDKSYLASHTEWFVLNAILFVLLLGFCFPLAIPQAFFFVIGWFFI